MQNEMTKAELIALAGELHAAMVKAAEMAGDVDIREVKCLKVWARTDAMRGRTSVFLGDASDKMLVRAWKFARAWLARKMPGEKVIRVKTRGYGVWNTYFSSGHFDMRVCGLAWEGDGIGPRYDYTESDE